MVDSAPAPQTQFLVDEFALVQDVEPADVWQWLARGAQDLKAAGPVSVVYAFLFTLLGLIISFGFYLADLIYLILPSLTGFVLIGPAGAVGYYEISRRLEAGDRASLWGALCAWHGNRLGIMGLGITLVFLFMIWIRLAFSTYALTFPGVMPELEDMVARALTWDGVVYAGISMAIGGIFAFIIFVVAAISLPMMLDRRTVLIPSLLTSAYAVYRNRRAMALWAAMIVVFIGAGLATALIGLLFTFPLIGHATWHCYRQVIRDAAAGG